MFLWNQRNIKVSKKSLFNTLLGFTPNWYYKPTNAIHADSLGAYTNEKIIQLSTTDKIHLKCDVFDGSLVNGVTQILLFSFRLNKPPGYKISCELESTYVEIINKSVSNAITLY